MKRFPPIAMMLALGVLAACNRGRDTEAPKQPARQPAPPPLGSNGLSAEDRQAFYHTPEGSELLPTSWLFALRQPGTEKPFLDNLERFGLIRDEDPANTTGLPIGLTAGLRRGIGVPMVGINCAACHVSEIEFKGKRIRIDGAPNMFDIAGFFTDLRAAAEEVLQPEKSLRFLERLRKQPAGFSVDGINLATYDSIQNLRPVPATKPTVLEDAEYIRNQASLAASYITTLVRFNKTHIDTSLGDTVPGFGRADAFGTARVLLFGPVNRIPLDAPVSFPHLWGIRNSRWIHWISNTNSVMQRNIGEALGLGASADPKTGESTIHLDNLHKLETLAYKIVPPAWPEELMGPIQPDRAERGKVLYDARCWGCHDDYGQADAAGRFAYRVFKPGEIGTDPMEALDFAKRLNDGRPFAKAQVAVLSSIADRYYENNDVPPETQAEWNDKRGPEVWRDMTDMDGKAYAAKPLAGVWATAPYLHNGSVPTLWDLLSPQAQRPVTFTVGQREYDPEKVGYQQSAKGGFLFDTRLAGNGNYGHEIPGTLNWTDEQKLDLVEFLKTISGRVSKGPFQPK